jgi:hypothetical protein
VIWLTQRNNKEFRQMDWVIKKNIFNHGSYLIKLKQLIVIILVQNQTEYFKPSNSQPEVRKSFKKEGRQFELRPESIPKLACYRPG